MSDLLERTRAELFREIADLHGSMIAEQVEFVYDVLTDRGLIDYDIEKEVLLGDEEDE